MGSEGSAILGENRDLSLMFLDPRNRHLLVRPTGHLPRGRGKGAWGSGICNWSCPTLGMREASMSKRSLTQTPGFLPIPGPILVPRTNLLFSQ